MSLSEYLDDDRKEFVEITMSLINIMSDRVFNYNNEIGDHLKKTINTNSRGTVKSILHRMRMDKHPRDDEDFENQSFCKLFFILEAHGYSSLAEDIALSMNRRFVKDECHDVMYKEIFDGAAYMNRKTAASGSRHQQKEEIVDVIRETWIAFPWGSRTKMISYVIENYRVVEKTLKQWMKEEGLAPLSEVQNKKYHLVIPEKWKKKAGVKPAIPG